MPNPTIFFWLYDITSAESAALLEQYADIADPAVVISHPYKQQMHRFSFIMRRVILAQRLGTEAKNLEFYVNSYGKPGIPNSDISFNISHSGHYWCMAVVQGYAVGVDIECIKARRREEQIIRKYFLPEEYAAYLAEGNAEKRTELFFKLWTQKEAMAKMYGIPLLELVASPEKQRGEGVFLYQQQVTEGMMLAVACDNVLPCEVVWVKGR